MSKTAPKKNADTGLIPTLPASWELTVLRGFGPPLSELKRLNFSHQGAGESSQLILGNVSTAPPKVTIYAIEDGKVAPVGADPNPLQMSFTVTISGIAYDFTGTLNGDTGVPMGTIKSRLITPNRSTPNPIFEDGNWSAQAQGGGDDDDGRPDPKHRHRRSR
jgi:hypothetical protein